MGVLIFDDRDPAITYSADWALAGSDREFNSTTSWTATEGATARLTFTGSKVSVFGTIAGGIRAGTPISSYAIDNSTPTVFEGAARIGTQFNQAFFESPALTDGVHTLTITNLADVQLFLDLIVVTPLDQPLQTTVTTTATVTGSGAAPTTVTVTAPAPSVSTPSRADSDGAQSSESAAPTPVGGTNTAAIAGGVIGAVLLLLLLGAGFFFLRRRQTRKSEDDIAENYWTTNAASGTIAPFPPPKQTGSTPSMSQAAPFAPQFQQQPQQQAYPDYAASQYTAPSQGYPTSTTNLNDPVSSPSELAYYNNDYSAAYPQTSYAPQPASAPYDYSAQPMQPNGRVRVNLNSP